MPATEVYVLITVPRTTKKGCKAPGQATLNADALPMDPVKPRTERPKRRREPLPSTTARNKRQKVDAEKSDEKKEVQESMTITPQISSPSSRKRQPMSREEYLRSHPYADVQSPTLVVCRLCGAKIKLSSKGTYGPYHWDRHIKHCKENAEEEHAPKRISPTADTSEAKGANPRKRLRASPGSTPLKLKISRKTLSQGSVSPETDDQLISAPAGLPPSSQQSDTSCESVMTPFGPHEDLSVVTVHPPSDCSSDETQTHLLDCEKETSVPKLQWTDGLLTTSPQEAVFGKNSDLREGSPHSNASVAGAESESQGEDVAIGPPQDHDDINFPCQTRLGEKQSDAIVEQESPAPATLIEHNSLSFQPPRVTTQPSSVLPTPDPEDDLELEYPEWEPPPVVGIFEQELRAAGYHEAMASYVTALTAMT